MLHGLPTVGRGDDHVNCTQCGTDNKPNARFCRKCGSAAAVGCSACAAELDADDDFCSSCGTAVAPAATSANPAAVAETGAIFRTNIFDENDLEVARAALEARG